MGLAKIYTEGVGDFFFYGSDVAVETKGNFVGIHGRVRRNLDVFIKKYYGHNAAFYDAMFSKQGYNFITLHNFFVPELIYILSVAIKDGWSRTMFTNLMNELITNTWYKDTQEEVQSAVDLSVLDKLGRTPLPHQLEFIRDVYWQRKTQFKLKGYLLSLDTGLGKTTTSIMLKECLHKKHAIVIAPLSVAKNVWPFEIKDIVPKATIWNVTDSAGNLTAATDYVVINYEFIGKLLPLVQRKFKSEDTIIIVDECHNFKDVNSKRTTELVDLCNMLQCNDILLMSATPVKAMSVECLPIFKLLDTFYDSNIENRLRKMSRYTRIINELLCNRLGYMMFRKLKTEVLELPGKHELELKVKIPNGNDYTLDEVKKLVINYTMKRMEYYHDREDEYVKKMMDILDYYEKNCMPEHEAQEYASYVTMVKDVRAIFKQKVAMLTPDVCELIKSVNKYEKDVIIPRLPNNLKKEFRDAKSVYKYVRLKVLGEVIGNLLTRLRMSMTSDLLGKEVIDIIKTAKKRTILFSSYVDSLAMAEDVCSKAGLQPMVIDGSNSKQVKDLLDEFRSNENINPLIASTKVMSTGHTIVECNTVIFLNVPFRSVDYYQASDRVYRIGQDTDVYIYKLVLDTGTKENLSTRMQDILVWSKGQFNEIMGESDDLPDSMHGDVKNMIQRLANPDESIFDICKQAIKKIFS